MQIFKVIILWYRTFKDFWGIYITTYSYIDLKIYLDAKSNEVDSFTANTESNINISLNTHNFLNNSDSINDNGFKNTNLSSINQTLDNNITIDSIHNKNNKESIQSHSKSISNDANNKITSFYHILKQPYITLTQLYNSYTKPHPLANIFHRKKSMCMYYTVLPLDYLIAVNIDIEKNDLRQKNMLDSIIPLRAKNKGLVPYNYECKYFLQSQTKTHFNFQVFAIKKETLHHYALNYSGKIICLNPIEMFSSLYVLYPHLQRYTIMFQDSNKHAICHYINGMLVVSIVIERTEALQNYYSLIEDFGEIFYCDFSGKADLLLDFRDIKTLFNMPLKDCLHILALQYISAKPTYIHFYAKSFYNMRSFVKILLFTSLCSFIFYFLTIFYHKYEYYEFLKHEAITHRAQIDSLYYKKQQYPLIYERVYKNLLETHSLNFCLEQDYNTTESTWIQTDCNKP